MKIDPKTGYFKDGIRKIHYVIVVKEENLPLLNEYFESLHFEGIDVEIAVGVQIKLIFALLHLTRVATGEYSREFNIGLEKPKVFRYQEQGLWHWTPFKELPPLPKGTQEVFTSADCIIMIKRVLERTGYGDGQFDIGITKLKKTHIIVDSYPLHDGPINLRFKEFNHDNLRHCNDREILYRYWSNFRVLHYEIPLELIKKYYGYEIAFYFRWLEYFNIMLFPVAALGLFVVLINIILLTTQNIIPVSEICNSHNMYLCPTCIFQIFCKYSLLSDYCELAKWTYVFDNYLTVFFAILMSFWATLFLNLWKRKTNELRLKWDITYENVDTTVRVEAQEKIKNTKYNYSTGKWEPCLTPFQLAVRSTFVVIVCLLLIIPKVALWLTLILIPKSNKDADRAVLYIRYILSFFNNYSFIFYTAFLKGSAYGSPKDSYTFLIEKDTCQPLACIMDLTSQLCFLMLFRKLFWNFLNFLYVLIVLPIKRWWEGPTEIMTQYEQEYLLIPTTRNMLHKNHFYSEMILDYGFVTFFGAAFPLAPLFAFLDNILEMRISAKRLISHFRRPIPKIIPGIGPWEGILLGQTYLSTAINAFVIAFTTQFVSRTVFMRTKNFHLHGFINYTLSEFATNDSSIYDNIESKQEICYYRGMREPPTSENKYARTTDFWINFTWRLVFIVVFEHVILTLNGILSYSISKIPPLVREYVAYGMQVAREAKIKLNKAQEEAMFMRYRGRELH